MIYAEEFEQLPKTAEMLSVVSLALSF